MQENKNLIIAIVLCLIVLFGWGHFAEYMGWVQRPAPTPPKPTVEEAPVADTSAKSETLPVFTPAPGQDIAIRTPLYEAIFYSGGGTVRSFVLNKYRAGIRPDSPLVNLIDEHAAAVGPMGLVVNGQPSWSTGQWSLDSGQTELELTDKAGALALSGLVDNLRISRQFEFDPATYLIKEKLKIANSGDQARSVRLSYTQAMDGKIAGGDRYDSMTVAWDQDGSLEDEDATKVLAGTGVQATGLIYWAGPMSTYFLTSVLPGEPEGATVKGRLAGDVYRVALEREEFVLQPGQTRELAVSYWLGPKDRAQMAAVSDQLPVSINLGFFSGIGKCLLWLLEFFYQYVHNWGIAIILLTCLIKAAFWPLTAKSYASMEKMKQLSPMMKTLQEKYKGNREELNKEVMALYKTYRINPASGCVPILIQLPVFFGLYQALLTSLALRHASFITYLPGTNIIWLADLSAKDPLYITPIVMGLTMFLQQRMSPPPADPMQQKIMMFLPLIFTVLFLNFPSGLVLYWLANNILSILQQWLMIRKSKKARPLAPPESSPADRAKKSQRGKA